MLKGSVVLLVPIFFVINAVYTKNVKAPSYITICSQSDPNINECALKSGTAAIPSIIKGDAKYKIPNMLPFRVAQIKFSTGDLHIELNDVDIFGFDRTVLKEIKMDMKNRKVVAVIEIDNANIKSDYIIDGKILILPIQGNGRANITFVGGEYIYSFDFDKVMRNGEEFAHMFNTKLEYNTKRSYYYFENLFGSGKTLGIDVNQFLNDNWKDVQNDIGPALSETINQIITTVLNGFFNTVPFDKLFLQ